MDELKKLEEAVNKNLRLIYHAEGQCLHKSALDSIHLYESDQGNTLIRLMEQSDLIETEDQAEIYYLTEQGYRIVEQGERVVVPGHQGEIEEENIGFSGLFEEEVLLKMNKAYKKNLIWLILGVGLAAWIYYQASQSEYYPPSEKPEMEQKSQQ